MKGHLKSLTVPNTWPLKRKETIFTARPLPSRAYKYSIPLLIIFKRLLRVCKTAKEVRTLLREKEVLINQKRVYHPKTLLGIFDVLSIPATKEHYILVLDNHNTLALHKLDAKEAAFKISKVKGKTVISKDKMQVNLFEGYNVLVKKSEQKVGDSVVLALPDLKIKETLELKKGAYAFLIGGNHVGEHGTVESIKKDVVVITSGNSSFETKKMFVYVVGDKKPKVSLP